MAEDDQSGRTPWHHNPTVVFSAGGVALVLVAALVYTVISMSDQWSTPDTTLLTTTTSAAEPTPSREGTSLIITPSESSTSFTTSVPLSTTDIGLPQPEGAPGPETTSGTSESPTSDDESTESADPDEDAEPTTTRKRPRLNQTRTLFPQPAN